MCKYTVKTRFECVPVPKYMQVRFYSKENVWNKKNPTELLNNVSGVKSITFLIKIVYSRKPMVVVNYMALPVHIFQLIAVVRYTYSIYVL